MTDSSHPASSVDFLSRLYDGELPALEREAFERHRAECEACRLAADSFARSLAAFRAEPTVPAAADLSARILRKIRAQSPSRRPFGVMFGIDIRWAGLLAAAILVVLISAPLVLRRPSARSAPRPPFSARLVEAPAEMKVEAPAQAKPEASRADSGAPSAPAPALSKDEAGRNAASLSRNAPSAEPPADDEKRRYAAAPSAEAAPPARAAAAPMKRSRTLQDSAGGEAAAPGAAEATIAAAPPRLVVTSADEERLVPAVAAVPDTARLSALRGREYVLTVDASGRIRSVERSSSSGFLAPRPQADTSAAAADPADALRGLRFAPCDRPRRLIVRIE